MQSLENLDSAVFSAKGVAGALARARCRHPACVPQRVELYCFDNQKFILEKCTASK